MWSIKLEFVVGNSFNKIQPGTHVPYLEQLTHSLRGLHTRMAIIDMISYDCVYKNNKENSSS